MLAFLAALLALGLLFVSSAAAAPEHPFLETFGSVEQPKFAKPESLAIDQSTGDVLVMDAGAGTVSRFHADGSPAEFSALGSNKIEGLSFGGPGEVQIAVDNSSGETKGDIYVPQEGAKVVNVYASTGEKLGTLSESEEGAFSFPCGVAVDPSGNMFLGDFSGHVHKFTPTSNAPFEASNSANFEFGGNCTIAAGAGPTAGFIFPAHFHGAVVKLDSSTGKEEYAVNPGEEMVTVTVDPATGRLYTVAFESGEVREWDASGSEPLLSSTLGEHSEAVVTGIAVNETTGNVYVARKERETLEVWGPLPPNRELKLDTTGAGSGTVTSTPAGISCGSECSAEFGTGTEIELVATPAEGSEFAGWTTVGGAPGTCTGTTSPCKVTISEATELEADFELAPPTVTSLSPVAGPVAGANPVTVSGVNLAGASKVEFGSTVVNAPFTEDTQTRIVLDAPAHAAGAVHVTVTTPGGVSTHTASDEYTFTNAPTVTALTPSRGSTGGGTLEVTGTNLSGASQVKLGATVVHAPFTEDTATKIVLTVPAHAQGTVPVTVTTPGGESASTPADEYTFIAPPAVTGLTPGHGSTEGSVLTIIGLRLAEASTVEIGSTVIKAPFISDTATSIVLNAPAHAVGTVHVRVTTPGGTSSTFPADEYTYEVLAPVLVTEIPGSPGTPPITVKPPPPPPPPAPSNRITAVSAAQHGSTVSLKLTLPGAGVLSATGKSLARATVTVRAAGPLTLSLKLTAAAKRQLKRKHKLRLTVKVLFTPTGGTAGTVTETVTLKAARKRKG
jgi:hypothetical protein